MFKLPRRTCLGRAAQDEQLKQIKSNSGGVWLGVPISLLHVEENRFEQIVTANAKLHQLSMSWRNALMRVNEFSQAISHSSFLSSSFRFRFFPSSFLSSDRASLRETYRKRISLLRLIGPSLTSHEGNTRLLSCVVTFAYLKDCN